MNNIISGRTLTLGIFENEFEAIECITKIRQLLQNSTWYEIGRIEVWDENSNQERIEKIEAMILMEEKIKWN